MHPLRRMLPSPTLVLTCGVLACARPAPTPAAAPEPAGPTGVAYRLSPIVATGGLTGLSVELRFTGDPSGRTRVHLPEEWASERELWRHVEAIEVDGARAVTEDGPAVRVVDADPNADLVMRYRVVSAYDHEPSAADGQPFAPIVRPTWFYAFGEALFAEPHEDPDRPASFAWVGAPSDFGFASDLEHLPAHAVVGDVRNSIVLGGPAIAHFHETIGDAPIHVAIHGGFGFEHRAFVDMARTILTAERDFWGEHGEPFTIVLAPLRAEPGRSSLGGTGRSDGFTIMMSDDAPIDPVRHLIAHEYFHTWNPERLGGMPVGDAEGQDAPPELEMSGKWFTEGFTEFYTWRLLLRAGLYTLEDFVAVWNRALLEYANSPVKNEPNARIVADYWTVPDVGQLPYRRGPLFAALVDQQLRTATAGARDLDDVLHAMQASLRAAPDRARAPDAATAFPAAYVAAGGPDLGPLVLRYIERGETIELPADVFGGCIRVVTMPGASGRPTVQRLEIVGATTPAERASCATTVSGG